MAKPGAWKKMEELKKLGIVPVKMDITDQKDIDAVSDKILSEEGRLDVLKRLVWPMPAISLK